MFLYYDMHLISSTHLTVLITFGNTCTSGVSFRGGRWGFSTSTWALTPTYILEICIGVVWKTYEIPRLLCLDPRVPKMLIKSLVRMYVEKNKNK